MIPAITITLHIAAGHLVRTPVLVPHAYALLNAKPQVTGSYINAAPFIIMGLIDAIVVLGAFTLAVMLRKAFPKLRTRTA